MHASFIVASGVSGRLSHLARSCKGGTVEKAQPARTRTPYDSWPSRRNCWIRPTLQMSGGVVLYRYGKWGRVRGDAAILWMRCVGPFAERSAQSGGPEHYRPAAKVQA